MNPVTINAITDVVKTLGTLIAICWCVGRVTTYWTARLPHFGPEIIPGVASVRRKAQDDEATS